MSAPSSGSALPARASKLQSRPSQGVVVDMMSRVLLLPRSFIATHGPCALFFLFFFPRLAIPPICNCDFCLVIGRLFTG